MTRWSRGLKRWSPITQQADVAERSAVTAPEAVRSAFERQRAAFARDSNPDYETRISRLRALLATLLEHREEIATAIDADFGGRSWHETMFIDVFGVASLIRYNIARLKGWMAPRRRDVELFLQPARAQVWYQPKGVVGILAPWNYPVYLCLGPLCSALAAGNRAIVKPSEAVPATSAAIARMLGAAFAEDLVTTITGGQDVAQALCALPLDHLFFTGSATAARSVLRSAAENLTPVTLELGGKSPLIVHRDYPPAKAVKRIVVGKFFNAGQTCVAPDYVLVHKDRRDELVSDLRSEIARAYPHVQGNADYASIIDDRHYARLLGLVEDARTRGASVIEVAPPDDLRSPGTRKIPPTILVNVADEARVMQEEVFGPVLPVVEYDGLDSAIAYVNARPRPLGLYYFDDDRARVKRVLEQTISGGAGINEAALQVLNADLPFGGVGASGIGAYHGGAGFATFSHAKAVLARGRINSANLLAPPYGWLFKRVVRFLIGSR